MVVVRNIVVSSVVVNVLADCSSSETDSVVYVTKAVVVATAVSVINEGGLSCVVVTLTVFVIVAVEQLARS